MPDGTRYVVILNLGDTNVDRLKEVVPALQTVLEHVSSEPIQQVFRSVQADVFAYFVRSRLKARQIYSLLQSPKTQPWDRVKPLDVEPFLRNGDGLLVLELGDDFMGGEGFSRAWTWLQRH